MEADSRRTVLGLAILTGVLLAPAAVSGQSPFRRGDSNSDGTVDVSDGVFTLSFLFLGQAGPTCLDAADANDSGKLDLSDAFFTFSFLFTGGPAPPPPGSWDCGLDPTSDPLGCRGQSDCPSDTVPPVITAVTAAATTEGAAISWSTDEPADSTVEYGLDQGLGAVRSDPAPITAHRIVLDGLDPGTRYFYRVRSTDGARNSSASAIAAFTVRIPPVVENLASGEELPFNLALLRGSVEKTARKVSVACGGRTLDWPASGGRFKALVPLAAGSNSIHLDAEGAASDLLLRFVPQANPRFLRLVYILAADGDGTFDAPTGEPHDTASAVGRISLAGWMLQTFTADRLEAQGLGRRTFRLELDAQGQPAVTVRRSDLTMAQAQAMSGGNLWSHFYSELGSLPLRDLSHDLVIMQMTHYDPATKTALAHTALGGGRLALFGSANLHTWAPSLGEVLAHFADGRMIDTTKLCDDSGGRGTYWANYATGIGASLHEAGHCFSLPHTANGTGILSRQFDCVNRMFALSEPAANGSAGLASVSIDDEPTWHRSNAVRLRFHRWFAVGNVSYAVNVSPAISLTATEVRVSSAAGIRHIAYHVDGNVFTHDEFLDSAPKLVRIPLDDLLVRRSGVATFRLSTIDSDGNIAEADVPVPDPMISGLRGSRDGNEAVLAWTDALPADGYRIYLNGTSAANLPAGSTGARVLLNPDILANRLRVVPLLGIAERPGAQCTILTSTSGLDRIVDEDFSPTAPASKLAVNGNASQLSGALQLTPPSGSQAGSAFFLDPFDDARFAATVDLRFADPSSPGADGLTVIFNAGDDVRSCGGTGGSLGYFHGLPALPLFPGFAIAFDTWQGAGEPSHNWVGFYDAAAGNDPVVAVDVPEEFTGNGTFKATVIAEAGTFTLLLANPGIGMAEREIFSHAVPGFRAAPVRLGFSAGTGGAVTRHIVDNVVLLAAPAGGGEAAAGEPEGSSPAESGVDGQSIGHAPEIAPQE